MAESELLHEPGHGKGVGESLLSHSQEGWAVLRQYKLQIKAMDQPLCFPCCEREAGAQRFLFPSPCYRLCSAGSALPSLPAEMLLRLEWILWELLPVSKAVGITQADQSQGDCCDPCSFAHPSAAQEHFCLIAFALGPRSGSSQVF